jgi:sulfur carrier protein ThiS
MKDQFTSKVNEFLEKLGFVKNENIYELNKNFVQKKQVIIVNGQRMEQPGQNVNIKYVITDLGDGYISNVDDSNKIDLIFYKIEVYVQDVLEGEYSSGYGFDEYDRLEREWSNILNKR